MTRRGAVSCLVFALVMIVPPDSSGQTRLTAIRIASGLDNPVWAGSPPGDERVFILEYQKARVRIVEDGVLLATPFLDILPKVNSGLGEGVLGMAFHPDFANNGYVYVHYTRLGDINAIVERYQVSASDPDRVDPSSGVIMFGPVQHPIGGHQGGCIAFSPIDGYLYIALGDGGGQGDPTCEAQKPSSLSGKLCRIDVDQNGAAPPSNPFFGDSVIDDRVWAFGLRNPWRFSFDRETGELYIGDVGQLLWEEINWAPAMSTGGENYGWKVMEGNHCYSTASCGVLPPCGSPSYTAPIHEYAHGQDCSVTGGYVYRGCAIPDLKGVYFYADYCSGRIFSFRNSSGTVSDHLDRSLELDAPNPTKLINDPVAFGEDGDGELLIVDLDGDVFKVVPAAPAPGNDLGFGLAGGNGSIPVLEVCGLLESGNSAVVNLSDAREHAASLLFVSNGQQALAALGGTLVPDIVGSPFFQLGFVTDAQGAISLPATGGGGVFSIYLQYLITDPGAPAGVAFSNALQLTFQP